MKLFTCLILLSFLIFNQTGVFAQNYFFKEYGLKEGLPHTQLHDVLQAKDNTLWVTSAYGVIQFDGSEFTSFTKNDGLCSNQIISVFEDSKGRIWCGSWQNDGVSIIENGKITTPNDSILKKKRGVLISAYEDPEGNIWLFGYTSIIKYDNKKFELIYESTNIKKGEKSFVNINSVVEGNDPNTVYISSTSQGIAKVTLSPFRIEKIFNSDSHQINNICFSSFKDANDVIWVGYYGGLLSIKNDKITKYDLPGDFNNNRVWSINEDKKGYLWLALYGGGIVRWDKQNEFIFANESNGLVSNFCYDMIIDKENNKWITTEEGGLIRFRDFSFKYYDETNGLNTNWINGVVQNKNLDIVASSLKGLAFINKEDSIDLKLTDSHITSMAIGANDTMWVATENGYGYYNDGQLVLRNEDLKFTTIKYNKHLLVGGYGKVFLDGKEILDDPKLFAKTGACLNNKVLVGFYKGLKEIKRNNSYKIRGLNGLSSEVINSSCIISESEVFFGTPYELVYLKSIKDSFLIKYFPIKRLNNIRGINAICINKNDLWIGSDNSLSKINWKLLLEKDSVDIWTIHASDGYLNGIASFDGIICDKNGKIWLATYAGLMSFDPNQYDKNNITPYLKIKSIKMFSEVFNEKKYRKKGKPSFPYNKNHLTFNISAISLTNPEGVQYKYRLVGLDKEWSAPTKNREIIYSYLPPGDYQFEFIASNGTNGIWTKIPKTYSFSISPPFWETIWFRLLVILAIMLVALGLLRRQKKRAKQKEIVQDKFTKDLIFAQEDERKRISKELHDGIGQQLLLIKNTVRISPNNEIPEMIDNTINEVRTISRNLHPFQLENLGLTKALETMVLNFSEATDSLFISEEIENIDGLLSKEKEVNLYRIFQECINNIFKHSNASAARVSVRRTESGIDIEIKDNGIGFDVSSESNNLNSLGLKSIRERVKIINGSIQFNSRKGENTTILINIQL